MGTFVYFSSYKDVAPDGTIGRTEDRVPVDGQIVTSPPDGGCGHPSCTCFRGHFFHRLFPRDESGIVFGYSVEFDSHEELQSFNQDEIARMAQLKMH
ncbi:hypothetical protein QF002_001282 [Paraburkholderia youngii]